MSHPTQTLRDKVWSVLNNVWVGDSEEDLYIKTDAILDLVREALLSDDAVNDASFGYDDVMYPEDKGTQNALYRATERDHQAAITSAITAALDAVAGEDDER